MKETPSCCRNCPRGNEGGSCACYRTCPPWRKWFRKEWENIRVAAGAIKKSTKEEPVE